jgi:hypothetical protein
VNKTKYIVIASEGEELIFTFPESIAHVHMFEAVRTVKQGVPQNWNRPHWNAKIVSAGFVYPSGECHGHSETLGVKSRGQVDTKLLDIGNAKKTGLADAPDESVGKIEREAND